MTNTEWMRQRLYDQVGFVDVKRMPSLDSLQQTEWDSKFEGLMRQAVNRFNRKWDELFIEFMQNRLLLGAFRYGFLHREDKYFDAIGSAIDRLGAYQRTGDLEMLVDIANMCLVEFAVNRQKDQISSLTWLDSSPFSAKDIAVLLYKYQVHGRQDLLVVIAVTCMHIFSYSFGRSGFGDSKYEGHAKAI